MKQACGEPETVSCRLAFLYVWNVMRLNEKSFPLNQSEVPVRLSAVKDSSLYV